MVFLTSVGRARNVLCRRLQILSLSSTLQTIIPKPTPTPLSKLPSVVRPRFLSSEKPPLVEVLDRELAEERAEKSTEIPLELSEVLSLHVEPHWRLVDDPGSARVTLFKKVGKVAIEFHCQDTVSDPDLLERVQELVGEEEEEADPLRFTVTVRRADTRAIFHCVTENAEVRVESITVESSIEENSSPGNLYQGPEFSELDEDLQESLTAFVREDCGVDENVAAFLSMYSDYKEQTQYVTWLEGLKSIV